MGAAPAPIPAPPLAPGPPGSGSGPRSSSRQRLLPPVPSAGPESSLGRTRFPRPDPSLPSAGPESSLGRTRVFPRPDPSLPSAGSDSLGRTRVFPPEVSLHLLRYHPPYHRAGVALAPAAACDSSSFSSSYLAPFFSLAGLGADTCALRYSSRISKRRHLAPPPF
jgi:hypothetical protein